MVTPSTQTRASSLADQIRHEILDQGLTEGDLFMTDAEISQRYRVSRNIAREAVSRLRGLGILRSRRRKGLLVHQPDPVQLWRSTMPFLGRSRADIADVAMFRYALEMGAIEAAVAEADDQQIEQLVGLAEEHARSHTDASFDAENENKLELRFHSLILEMTGNRLIIGVVSVLRDFFRMASETGTEWSQTQFNPQTVWQHQAIAEAIRQRDADQARVLMKQHLGSLLAFSRNTTDDEPTS